MKYLRITREAQEEISREQAIELLSRFYEERECTFEQMLELNAGMCIPCGFSFLQILKDESEMKKTKVQTGTVVMSGEVAAMIEANDQFAEFCTACMGRYAAADWGEMDPEDLAENDKALSEGYRILASYKFPEGMEHDGQLGPDDKLWIITEHDRSVTTLLFPSDY